ncbi:hypothetical protein LUZ60_009195 [Juncus effusus]|nr:hypothetical protein LUZ60_009195 [Juncus effusus]
MPQREIKYAVIDAFTSEPFKGNPAAVCFLEENADVDSEWMQAVAKEFNISETAFLSRAISAVGSDSDGQDGISRFNLRWFTPASECELCGHATLAAAYFLFTSNLANGNIIHFLTKAGLLTTRKIPKSELSIYQTTPPTTGEEEFCVELDFPASSAVEESTGEEQLSFPRTLNGMEIVNVQRTSLAGDLIVELSSGKEVEELQINIMEPNFRELEKYSKRGVAITGKAPAGSGFDFFTRFFCPKFGVDEDPVCGSAQCALVPYWSKKLNKQSLVAFSASARSGVLYLELVEKSQRVKILGEAITVIHGTIIA